MTSRQVFDMITAINGQKPNPSNWWSTWVALFLCVGICCGCLLWVAVQEDADQRCQIACEAAHPTQPVRGYGKPNWTGPADCYCRISSN